MFTSFAAIVLVLPALASAVGLRRQDNADANGVLPTTNQCNTGPVQCCNQVQSADSSEVITIAALLGINVQELTALVGLSCSPITVIGGGGNSCSAQPVCCTNNSFEGVIATGCQPINI